MMKRQWIQWINLSLVALTVILLAAAGTIWIQRPAEITVVEPIHKVAKLPKIAFEQSPENYHAIGSSVLALKETPISLQLPDLRRYLIYYGKNDRPDADPATVLMHFSFINTQDVVSIQSGNKLYLVYDKGLPSVQYRFSLNNEETSLWFEPEPKDEEVVIHLAMKNEKGEITRKPQVFSEFTLKPRPLARFSTTQAWTIGDFNVDGTLLARQKAHWYGQDLFLQKHGGAEYQHLADKQRIDFGEGEESYSVYVNTGDSLVWDGLQWESANPGPETLGKPLLVIKKIDDRLMNLDLWDPEGKTKIPLNLIKSMERWTADDFQKNFKFVGARTRSQFVFEVNEERMLISPQDWLLFTEGEWKKLTTPAEIDAYVDRKMTGPLFVFDEITKGEGGGLVLVGTVFNSTRTEQERIEIPIQQGGTPTAHDQAEGAVAASDYNDGEDDEEDDEDDEEDDDDNE